MIFSGFYYTDHYDNELIMLYYYYYHSLYVPLDFRLSLSQKAHEHNLNFCDSVLSIACYHFILVFCFLTYLEKLLIDCD